VIPNRQKIFIVSTLLILAAYFWIFPEDFSAAYKIVFLYSFAVFAVHLMFPLLMDLNNKKVFGIWFLIANIFFFDLLNNKGR
jgi:heme/copper-type cytochrome/quinol oxidase subunit 4